MNELLPKNPQLLSRLDERLNELLVTAQIYAKFLEAKLQEEASLLKASERLPRHDQIKQLVRWGVGTADFRSRLTEMEQRIGREALSILPFADLSFDVRGEKSSAELGSMLEDWSDEAPTGDDVNKLLHWRELLYQFLMSRNEWLRRVIKIVEVLRSEVRSKLETSDDVQKAAEKGQDDTKANKPKRGPRYLKELNERFLHKLVDNPELASAPIRKITSVLRCGADTLKKLPVWKHLEEIRQKHSANQTVHLSDEFKKLIGFGHPDEILRRLADDAQEVQEQPKVMKRM